MHALFLFFFSGTFFRNRLVARITSQPPFFKFAGLSSKKFHHHSDKNGGEKPPTSRV